MKRQKALLVEEVSWGIYNKTPIWVYEITDGLFPVKFEYRQRGYKGIRFSERLNRIQFI